MADINTILTNVSDAINEAAQGGLVEEYEITDRGKRVRRGDPVKQLQLVLQAAAIGQNRFRLAKFREPRQ